MHLYSLLIKLNLFSLIKTNFLKNQVSLEKKVIDLFTTGEFNFYLFNTTVNVKSRNFFIKIQDLFHKETKQFQKHIKVTVQT